MELDNHAVFIRIFVDGDWQLLLPIRLPPFRQEDAHQGSTLQDHPTLL